MFLELRDIVYVIHSRIVHNAQNYIIRVFTRIFSQEVYKVKESFAYVVVTHLIES